MTRSVAAGLAVLLACKAGAGGTRGDAGAGDAPGSDAGVQVSGRACVVADLRQLTRCNATGAGGLNVALGAGSGTTNADGTFAFLAPLGAGFTWHVTRPVTGPAAIPAIIPSVMPFGTDRTIPVVTETAYTDLLASNGELVPDEQHGSIVVRVVQGATPVAGVKATLSPLADGDTRYDASNPTVWSTTSTGGNGVVWVPGVQLPGPVAVTLSTIDGKATVLTVPVERQAITFMTQSVP